MVSSTMIIQALVNGILLGGVYASFGVGVSLIWGVMKSSNFAHGAIAFLAAYFTYSAMIFLGIDPLISLPLLVPPFFLLGMVIYRTIIHPAYMRETQSEFELATMLLTFGLSLVLESLMSFFWGTTYVTVRSTIVSNLAGRSIEIGPLYLSPNSIVAFFTAVVSVAILAVLLERTYLGLAIRATSQNREVASMMGVNVYAIWLLSFGITIALGSMAGVAMSLTYSFYPQGNLLWTIKAFVVVVLGGLGSIAGTLAGGIFLGTSENIAAALLPLNFRDVVALAIFLAVLLIRPQGLFGRK